MREVEGSSHDHNCFADIRCEDPSMRLRLSRDDSRIGGTRRARIPTTRYGDSCGEKRQVLLHYAENHGMIYFKIQKR